MGDRITRDLLSTDARPAPLRVKVSDSAADIDSALVIVHRGFVAAGYSDPRPSGRRMHASYLNPQTVFALASIDDEPIGTIAMVADGPFGLPSDRAFAEELDELRALGPVREVGSLVIDERWRRHTRRVYMHMLATMVRRALTADDDTRFVLAVTPENARFTSGLFNCDVVGESRLLYGAPAVLLCTTRARLQEHYAEADTPTRREMRRLVFDPQPEWLEMSLTGVPPPREWWLPLLEEEGTVARLRNQLAVLNISHHGPGADGARG
ncbi:MAG TPA: hypothetical protein PKE32_07710 [Miltoncostaeaceae bacterium]|nr:hypothetical protein [Miltoncostaeaceae bacterium]